MFNVLYHRYIQQIKLQQIEEYNKKHESYLQRCGKKLNPEHQAGNVNINSKRNVQNKSQERPIKRQNNSVLNDENKNIEQTQIRDVSRKNREFAVSISDSRNTQQEYKEQRQIKSSFQDHKFQSQKGQPKLRTDKMQTSSNNSRFDYPQHDVQGLQQKPSKFNQQRTLKPNQSLKAKMDFTNQFPEQQEEIVLEQCPQGCGRKFNALALQKHVKLCQKVFQGKRKPFKVDVVDEQAKKFSNKNGSSHQQENKQKSEKPKWKKQSQLLRRGLKVQQQGPSAQSQPVQQQDDRVQCGGCGRKFNQKAAEKHIPSCLKRNKQKK